MNTISSMHTSPSYYGTTLHDKKYKTKKINIPNKEYKMKTLIRTQLQKK